MTFIEEAQQLLAHRIVPRLQDSFSHEEYVHRLLFQIKTDVQEALIRHRLRKTYKESDEDLHILEDRELAQQLYLCLIGNAGSGKSSVLTFGYLEAVRHFFDSSSASVPFFIDLGKDLPTDFSVERTLRAKYARLFQRALSESSAGCAMFLDGLDEALRKAPHFINDLTFFLEEYQPRLARVVIACRRAMWNAEWLTQDPVHLVVYHTDYLAETSAAFRDYLIASDALVAFLAEMPSLPREKDEQLLRSVLDDAIANNRAPWWELPPRGERPSDALPRHRPQDTAAFLQPYVESQNQFARLWGTFCAHAWGGSRALNPSLDRLAHDPQEHIDSRKAAIAAIAATRDLRAVRTLYDLFDDHDDQIRGEVLAAYHQLDSPSPQEFIAKLQGGARTAHAYGRLQAEAESFGHTLDALQLAEAFTVVTIHFESLKDLRLFVLRGLFHRAAELGFHDIPPALIVQCWIAQASRTELTYDREDFLTKLVKEHPALFERVWHSSLQGLAEETHHFIYLFEPLAKSCTDHIFDLLPPSSEGLTRSQESLITGILQRYFWRDSTAERLAYFQRTAPAFTQHLRLPAPPKPPRPHDVLHERQKLVEALDTGGTDPIKQTWNVLLATAEITREVRRRNEITEEAVSTVLDATIPVVKALIMQAFRDCVAQLHYECKPGFVTRPEFAIPFWVLRRHGEHFALQKVAEIACCYYGYPGDEAHYEALLEELRQRDHDLWRQTMLHILEAGLGSLDRPLRYLTKMQEDIYLSQCCELLEYGTFNGFNFGALLEYLCTFRLPQWMETLRRCYNTIRAQGRQKVRVKKAPRPDGGASEPSSPVALSSWEQFHPLLILMVENDEWAWREFAKRLRREDVPLQGDLYRDGLRYPLAVDSSRLPLIADWYALVCRKTGQDEMAVWGHGLAQSLRETLVMIGGEPAIRELRRLQESHAYPGVAWLSHAILRVEDRMFTEGIVLWTSDPLLDFVNKHHLGFIGSEQDLFAWVRQALDEAQDAMEQRAEGVAGFWQGQHPKSEPLCQNVLWPLMQLTFQKFGIAVVSGEENFIGKNRCDFWVEYPRQRESPFRVGIELKIARERYGRKDLVEPIETQLWKKYLRPVGCQHGLFVVLWFRDDQRYHGPTSWTNSKELVEELRKKCKELSKKHQVSMIAYVIDLTTPVREC